MCCCASTARYNISPDSTEYGVPFAPYSGCIICSKNVFKLSQCFNSMRAAAASLAELTYRAEALKQKQDLERQEAMMMERRKEEESRSKRELEEIKWIKKGNDGSRDGIRSSESEIRRHAVL